VLRKCSDKFLAILKHERSRLGQDCTSLSPGLKNNSVERHDLLSRHRQHDVVHTQHPLLSISPL
jgi:hypothetical protein